MLTEQIKATRTDIDDRCQNYRASYDRVAEEYVRRIADELKHKPLNRQLLDRFAASVRELGPVCDLGCGPGHVARHLRDQGVDVCGIDLSPGMIEQARRLNPRIQFMQGDMLALDLPDAVYSGIAAFYSIIHIPRDEVVQALCELRRILQPGGLLLLAFHFGEGALHLDEWWEHKVNVDFFFFQPTEMSDYLTAAGFTIEEIIEREPYPDVEHPSRRCYIFARRPDGSPQHRRRDPS